MTEWSVMSYNLYLMEELPQFNTKIFILYNRCNFKAFVYFCSFAAIAWLAVTATMV